MRHESPAPLPHPSSSTLLVIDVQEKLLAAMPEDASKTFVRAVSLTVELYVQFGGTMIVTEQYPRGLGPTIAPIRALVPADRRVFEKRAFSALREPTDAPLVFATDVVIVGMETHVCVLQTALDLRVRGHRVFIVDDGVLSRKPRDAETGLALMRDAGAFVIGCESLVFAALERAEGDVFKKFSAAIR